MRTRPLTVLALTLALCSILAKSNAQTPPVPTPSFVLLSRLYGPLGIYVPEAALVTPVPLNPAAQNSLIDLGMPHLAEIDFGQLSLHNGPNVHWTIGNYGVILDSRSTFRVSYNGLRSGNASLPITSPASIHFGGSAVDLTYAYRLNKWIDVGVAVVTPDEAVASLTLNGQRIASGGSQSTWEARGGILVHYGQLKAGFEFGEEDGRYQATIISTPSGSLPYHQRHYTGTLAWSPARGTTVFYSYQRIKTTAPREGLDLSYNTPYWGIEQALAKNIVTRFARVGSGTSVSATYLHKADSLTISYTGRAFSNTESLSGKGDLVFLSLAHEF